MSWEDDVIEECTLCKTPILKDKERFFHPFLFDYINKIGEKLPAFCTRNCMLRYGAKISGKPYSVIEKEFKHYRKRNRKSGRLMLPGNNGEF